MFSPKTMDKMNAFLQAASKELGYEVNHLQLTRYNRDENNTKRFAKTLEEDGFTLNQWNDGGCAAYEDYTKPVSISASYYFSLDAPEEEEANTCGYCGETAETDENGYCPDCDEKLSKFWEAEDKAQKAEYRKGAL